MILNINLMLFVGLGDKNFIRIYKEEFFLYIIYILNMFSCMSRNTGLGEVARSMPAASCNFVIVIFSYKCV